MRRTGPGAVDKPKTPAQQFQAVEGRLSAKRYPVDRSVGRDSRQEALKRRLNK